jgi:glycerol-3-phosphate dehydrogenase subunit C
MKIGRPLFRQMAEGAPDYVSSDCPIAGGAIVQGIEDAAPQDAVANPVKKAHPLTLIRMAYGL